MQYLKNIDEFKKVVFSFFRDHDDVNAAEMSRMLAGMFSYFKDSEKDETDSAVSTISEESRKDFREMWEGFVQKTIDFVNTHEDVKAAIETKKKTVTEKWNIGLEPDSDGNPIMIPDVRLGFSVDGLDESLKAGEWTPASDSYISLNVGNRSIIEMF